MHGKLQCMRLLLVLYAHTHARNFQLVVVRDCGVWPCYEGSPHETARVAAQVPCGNSFCREQQWGAFDSETVAAAAQVPCGNSFHQELQWVATPAGEGRARLVVSARVVFLRPLFGMRGLIESSSLEVRNSRFLMQWPVGFHIDGASRKHSRSEIKALCYAAASLSGRLR